MDWPAVAEDFISAASPEELASYSVPETKIQREANLRAKQWIRQRSTANWIKDQNYKGIAPSSAALLSHYVEVAGAAVSQRMRRTDRAGRHFAQKLRDNWGIRLGNLQVQDPISDADVQSKAG